MQILVSDVYKIRTYIVIIYIKNVSGPRESIMLQVLVYTIQLNCICRWRDGWMDRWMDEYIHKDVFQMLINNQIITDIFYKWRNRGIEDGLKK